MAYIKNALEELRDGELYLRITPGRARALLEALNITLSSGKLDKRRKGVITAVCRLLSRKANGHTLEINPPCWVYVAHDPEREQLTKIGHALNPDRRFARCTDRPTRLNVRAAWLCSSVKHAMQHEAAAQKLYKPFGGDGGVEWLKVSAEDVVDELTKLWGHPDRESEG